MRTRKILDAATRLFYERGFDAVGVDELGEAAGVSGPAIYRHFAGKDEILSTLFDEAMDRLLLLVPVPTDDPFHDLEALVRAQAEFSLTDSALVSIYAREDRSLASDARRRLARRQRQHVDRWVEVLSRCYPDRATSELVTAAFATIGLLLSAAYWPRDARKVDDLPGLLVSIGLGALAGTRHRPDD
ncbi:MAG: TetR/AcrR family transcriptional regulator [Solirubrobacteraceae bacterium]|nr:TetR/AcrR family transcriptional regulator [Solirubrobacteraceae bacterium]